MIHNTELYKRWFGLGNKLLLLIFFADLLFSNLLMLSIKADVSFLKRNQIEAINQLESLGDVMK